MAVERHGDVHHYIGRIAGWSASARTAVIGWSDANTVGTAVMTFPRERFRRGVQLCDGDIEVLLVTLGQPPRSRNSLLPHFQLRAANEPPLIAPSMIGAVLTSSMGLLGATLNLPLTAEGESLVLPTADARGRR